jgi:hypothetical protein
MRDPSGMDVMDPQGLLLFFKGKMRKFRFLCVRMRNMKIGVFPR